MKSTAVLYLSYDGMTDPLGQSQVLPYLKGLSENFGVQFYLISFEKPKAFAARKSVIEGIVSESGINWYPQVYHKSPPVLSTLYDLMKMYRVAKRICRAHDIQILHARSYLAGIVAMKIKSKLDIKFVFDIRGFWIEERVEGGLWNLNNPIFRGIFLFMKRQEKELFKNADAVVTLTAVSSKIIESTFSFKRLIQVIPCTADLSIFKPQSNEVRVQNRALLGIQDNYVLVYLGSVGTWYLLKEMLLFFKSLKKHNSTAKFLFLTKDAPQQILEFANKLEINSADLIFKNANREEVPPLLSAADSSIFFIKSSYSKEASSPTKHGEILGVGLPVVCNSIGDLSLIMKYQPTGVLVDNFSESKLDQAALSLLEQDFSGQQEVAVEFYSLEKGIQKYGMVYNSLLNELKS